VIPAADDLARGKATSASSSLSGQGAANAVDGSPATQWSSRSNDRQWWRVDLGTARSVGRVSLDWASAYGASVRVETSMDGDNWTGAAPLTVAAAGWQTASFANHSARYVRVIGVKGASRKGLSLRDVRVAPTAETVALLRLGTSERLEGTRLASIRLACARRAKRARPSRSRAVRIRCVRRGQQRLAART
jgi:hypothetical protein